MPFDITATPTLEAVATPDERRLASDLQERVDEALRQAAQRPDVAEAEAAHRAAEASVRDLQTAARTLNEHARELREQASQAAAGALGKLIESAALGGKPDYSQAPKLAALEQRERLTGRALERVVEHLTPLAQIARLRAESHALLTRARAMEQIAQERAEKVLNELRQAVADEVVLPVDMSKGVAGALLTQAAALKRLAVDAAMNADQMERAYMERTRKD
jgi:hypothetical protein